MTYEKKVRINKLVSLVESKGAACNMDQFHTFPSACKYCSEALEIRCGTSEKIVRANQARRELNQFSKDELFEALI